MAGRLWAPGAGRGLLQVVGGIRGAYVAAKYKKSAEKFGNVGKIAYLCRMKTKNPKDAWYVSGLNRLTGQRDQLTGITTHEDAASRMERYQIAAARQKYPTYTRLRLERAVAVQLTFNFQN